MTDAVPSELLGRAKNPRHKRPRIEVADLAGVIYSSGKVFEGLSTGRLDTENFLRSGSTKGVTSRTDLNLLEDLRDIAKLVINRRGQAIDAELAKSTNATIAKAQPFWEGNKRTALFVANAVLFEANTADQLMAPFDENDVSVASDFNDKLARAYLLEVIDEVIQMLRERGLRPLKPAVPAARAEVVARRADPGVR